MLLMGVVLSLGATDGALGATDGTWRVDVQEPGGGWRAVETELVLAADGRRNLHVVPDDVSAVYDGPARWSRHADGKACANHVVKAACARVPWRPGLKLRVQGPDAAARVKALGLGARPLAEGAGGFTFQPAGPVKAMVMTGDDAIRTLSLFVEETPETPDFSQWKHVIRFPRGEHAPGVVHVTNDCTFVWLDEGARLDAAIDIDGARHVRVAGPGTIDQSARCHGAADGFRGETFWGVYRDGELPSIYVHGNAEDVTVENLLVKSAFRGVCVRNAKNLTLRDLKVFTSNMNGDGFNAVNLQGLVARDLYIHAQDDAFCAYANADSIKYLWDGDGAVRQRRTGDFLVEDSLFWTSCRPFVFSGHGTGNRSDPDILENITIRRCSVVGSVYGCEAPSAAAVEPFAGCFRINSQSGTWTRNVLFEDIDFFWTKGFRSQAFCLEVRDAVHASYGESDGFRIEGVTWRDIRFHGIPPDTARSSRTVQVRDRPDAGIFNVRVENVTYDGRPADPFAEGPVRGGLSYDGTSPQKDDRDRSRDVRGTTPNLGFAEHPYADVRGFDFQPPWGSNGRDIWLERFDADEYRRLIRLGKKAFPKMNTLRVWYSLDAWYDNRELAVRNMRRAGEIIKSEGLKMIPVYFNNWHTVPDFGGLSHEILGSGADGWRVPFGNYLTEVAQALEPLQVVLVHDICNEPLNNCLCWEEGTARVRNFVAKMSDYLHEVSRAPVTVGSQAGPWKRVTCGVDCDIDLFAPSVDVISCHPYLMMGREFGTREKYLDWIVEKAAKYGKPVLATECCIGAPTVTGRVEILRKELDGLARRRIGFIAHGLTPSPVADLHAQKPGQGNGFNMPFMDLDGNVRPGHEAFNDY